ncbi:PCI-domain-containing protein [Thelephora ganbajun]|uniref:PCI-domain-containing protein n=1 Tax=Thelephora ganbajun TaxID=370292 RepID=A0ACB6ZPZ0_THEGA|nr:PCI-domain-containing protein [Thelephora ganbajun]
MATTDSVSVFAEGTFEDQIRELVDYLARGLSGDDRQNTFGQILELIKTVPLPEGETPQRPPAISRENQAKVLSLLVLEVKGLGEGSEKEVEGFFNLLFAHLFNLFPIDSDEIKVHVNALLKAITSPKGQFSSQYRLLSFLFNAIPRNSALRLTVYETLIRQASSHDKVELLQIAPESIERWTSEWAITPEQKFGFLRLLVEVFEKAGQSTTSYQYLLISLRNLPPDSPHAESSAIRAISASLRLPSVFDFDTLFKIDAMIKLQGHELFSLLKVFLSGGLEDYKNWESEHSASIEKYGLDKAQLERKIRLLTLASLGFQNIGKDVPYATLASALQVDQSEVERWVIDVIRAGLVSGKLSQSSRVFHITRSTSRVFERDQWIALEQRLVAWQTGLAAVLAVVTSAREKGNERSIGDNYKIASTESTTQAPSVAA